MPRGPRKLAVRFGTASLTHYGGAYLLHPFLSRIGFKEAIARHVRVAQRNNRYSVGEVLLALLYLSFAKTASGSLGDDPCPLGEANTPGDWWPSVQRGPVSIPPNTPKGRPSGGGGGEPGRAGLDQAACRA